MQRNANVVKASGLYSKMVHCSGTQLAQSVGHMSLDLRVVSLRTTLGAEITLKKYTFKIKWLILCYMNSTSVLEGNTKPKRSKGSSMIRS